MGAQEVSTKIVISKIMLMMVTIQPVGPLLLSNDFPVVKTQSRQKFKGYPPVTKAGTDF